MGAVLKRVLKRDPELTPPETETGLGDWNDLSGLLLPNSEEERIVSDIKDGSLDTIDDILDRFKDINDHYRQYQWTWTYRLILDYYHLQELTPENGQQFGRIMSRPAAHGSRRYAKMLRKNTKWATWTLRFLRTSSPNSTTR